MPHLQGEEEASSDAWVIREGISFVYGFDHGHSALTMTLRAQEAKRFSSQREAELWVKEYGKDLRSYRIGHVEGVHVRGLPTAARSTEEGWSLHGA